MRDELEKLVHKMKENWWKEEEKSLGKSRRRGK